MMQGLVFLWQMAWNKFSDGAVQVWTILSGIKKVAVASHCREAAISGNLTVLANILINMLRWKTC